MVPIVRLYGPGLVFPTESPGGAAATPGQGDAVGDGGPLAKRLRHRLLRAQKGSSCPLAGGSTL